MFPVFFPKVDYWFFMDENLVPYVTDNYKGQKIVTTDLVFTKYLQFTDIKPHMVFRPNIDLFGAISSATFAIDLARILGYKTAVLWGILDGNYEITKGKLQYKHFYDDEIREMSAKKALQAKRKIMSYNRKIQVVRGIL